MDPAAGSDGFWSVIPERRSAEIGPRDNGGPSAVLQPARPATGHRLFFHFPDDFAAKDQPQLMQVKEGGRLFGQALCESMQGKLP